jgi:hypothetical protein
MRGIEHSLHQFCTLLEGEFRSEAFTSVLQNHIQAVLCVSGCEEVLWVDAQAVIARVADMLAFRNLTLMQPIRDSMAAFCFTFEAVSDAEAAIAGVVLPTLPHPTTSKREVGVFWTVFIDKTVKAFN